ncbi:MAG: NAD-dependent epimerase/dehydratase family protein [Gemmatimonas sp.]|nr:NAD-dependent epimerase/dehydratase family protein [Gemmatimonas sp.]
MGRLALVTGATGFIGRHLVDRLSSEGWRVRALVRPSSDVRHFRDIGVELSPGDIRDPASIRMAVAGTDVVFHLAATTAARSELEYEQVNSGGTRRVVEAVRTASPAPRRLVYLSSYAAAGPAVSGRPRRLKDPPMPLTAYGRSKLTGETLVREAEREGVQVLVVRAPAVYGPGDRALLPYFRLVRWRLAPIPGGAERRLHLIFAPDLAEALRSGADAGPGTFAVAEPVEHRWADVVDAIAASLDRRPLKFRVPTALVRFAALGSETLGRLAGRAVPFNREKAEEMLAPAWTCDLTGSETLLPVDRATPLAEGLDCTVRWYLRQGWL